MTLALSSAILDIVSVRLASQEHSWFMCSQCFMQPYLPYLSLGTCKLSTRAAVLHLLLSLNAFSRQAVALLLTKMSFTKVVPLWPDFLLLFLLMNQLLLLNKMCLYPREKILWTEHLGSLKFLPVLWKKPSSFTYGFRISWFQNIFLLSSKESLCTGKRFALHAGVHLVYVSC